MHRSTALASSIALGLLVACGGDGVEPDRAAGGGSSGASSTASAGTGTGMGTSAAGSASNSGGAPGSEGGAPSSAGANAAGGTASVAGSGPSAGAGPSGGGTSGGASSNPNTAEYWIATTGADSNAGTKAAPLATLAAALPKVKPGVTLWLEAGTYKLTATLDVIFKYSGEPGKPVTLKAASGRPVLDFSGQARGVDENRGINLLANYWHIQGIELTKAADNCIAIAGSNNIVEDVIVHECGDTGIQITAPSSQATDDTRAANNTVVNCDSWGNLDSTTGGENADGFAAKLRIGPGNVFKGCRAWNNADDGWDLFAADDVVRIENSWAFSNGKPIGGSNPQGDGNGFKLGGEPNGAGQGGAVHLVSGSFAFENKACGFVRNNNPELPKLTSCGAKSNKTDYCSLTVSGAVNMSMSASAAIAAPRAADGSLPAMK